MYGFTHRRANVAAVASIVVCASYLRLAEGHIFIEYSSSIALRSRAAKNVSPHTIAALTRRNDTSCGADIIAVPRGGSIVDVVPETVDIGHLIDDAYLWCCSLGAPSALVAAAVVATIYENMHSGDLEIGETDGRWVQLGKKLTRLLLLSAFALETLSIFVTTVTGTMLLSRKYDQMLIANKDVTTPMEFLKENYEFEYLTASITFLQGLMHWLAAIALGHVLPSPGDAPDMPTEAALNKFIAWGMGTLILLMISFFNNHITFYKNYGSMLMRWLYVTLHGHVFGIDIWPPGLMSLSLMSTLGTSLYYGYISLSRSEAPKLLVEPVSDSLYGLSTPT